MNPAPHLPVRPATDLDGLVRQARAEMVFDRSRSSNLLGIPVGVLICSVLWNELPQHHLLLWLAAKAAVTLWRVELTRRFDRDRPSRMLHWERHFIVALAADGLVFGLLGTALLPRQDPVLAMAMVATLVGIAAAALVVLSMSTRASMALTVPVLGPALLWQLAQGDAVSLYVGAGMAVFLALVVVEGRRAALHGDAMLRLQFTADDLARQRQQALDLAERSSAVKSRFLAAMSHEMRTPLHGVLGLARLLQRDAGAEPAALRAQRLQTLERTGEHLLTLINDVLDHARIEGGHLRLQQAPFDLDALLRSVAELGRVAATEKGLTLELQQPHPGPLWVLGDAARLRQVLLNLLGNAVKFTDAGGIVLARHSPRAGWVVVDVVDTGPGVAEADRERIFQAFEQLDGSFARRHGGTGLGLAIARELAEAMAGTLTCHAAEGGGACFRLQIPAAPATPPPTPPHRETALADAGPDAPLLSGHVLLAEDNAVNALVAEAVLRRAGLQVTVVSDGARAVAEATFGPPRYTLVLMDCQMPGFDGFEATARIRQFEALHSRPRLPIVALTANAMEGDRQRCLQAGMDAHLAKPFREHELLELVQRHQRR